MIVVVEGPSAAGKTSWVEAWAGASIVPEERHESPPDPEVAARYWADHGADRWQRALALERETGLAVCDTDPLKLHYAWSMWRIGPGTRAEFEAQLATYRDAVDHRRLGFADRYLVTVPERATLEMRRAADTTRRRKNFDVHVRLAEPLREWYAALDKVRPGSVHWELAPDLLASGAPRSDRYRIADFDALLERLGAL